MRQVGAKNMQNHLRSLCGVTTLPQKSSLGNHFYVNDPRDIISMDFANPEITDGPVSETWQAEHWKEVPLDLLTPAAHSASGSKQFYVNELNELQDGRLVIPIIWMRRHGELHADCRLVHIMPDKVFISIPLTAFCYNYFDILSRGPISFIGEWIFFPKSTSCHTYASNMPNPLRQLAEDEDLITVFIPLWADDVSTCNVYMVNSNLPGRLLQQEYFVKFVSTSPHASAPEQFEAIMPLVQESQKKPVRFRLIVPALPADNPQQAEEASHIGMNANCKCRRCKAGGSHEVQESDEGYHALHEPGELRNVTETREVVIEQLKLAALGVAQKVADHQTATGVKDKIAQHWIEQLIKKAREIKATEPGHSSESISDELAEWLKSETAQPFSPLLTISTLNPTQDTPVELLHTILLGLIKYSWHSLHTSWTEANQDLFTMRLQATDIQGLSIPPIRASYMIQYRNGLIGKHFKTIMQTATFHVHDIATPAQFKVTKALGELGAVLWIPEIDNMEQYLHDLGTLIDNALDAFDDLDPARILVKGKLHVLKHILVDIRRFGPAIRFSTEIFECFNAIFRMCSVLSNHQAPSRDIAHKLADIDRVKHILSGGYWLQHQAHVQAGKDVRSLLKQQPIIQRHLGWTPDKPFTPGSVKLYPQSKCKTYICKVGAWVVAIPSRDQENMIGCIAEILVADGAESTTAFVTLDTFLIGDSLHSTLGMPILQRPSTTQKTYHAIHFILNVQHDCCTCTCQPTAS
ncbi:hypothetical protein BKA93DRAFT_817379 [Sparassis latifolia]